MKKIFTLSIVLLVLVNLVGCADQKSVNGSIEMDTKTAEQFYIDGMELVLELAEQLNEREYDFTKSNVLKRKYSKYKLDDKQKKFYDYVVLCVGSVQSYKRGLDKKDDQLIKASKYNFSHDMNELLKIFQNR